MDKRAEDLSQMTVAQKRQLLARLLAKSPRSFPLSYGQRALWTVYELAPSSAAYNIALRLRISAVDPSVLRLALHMLASRHLLLRTTIGVTAGEPEHRVAWDVPVALTVSDASEWSDSRLDEALHADAQEPFELQTRPAFRAHLFTRPSSDHVLQLTFHHIVYDLGTAARVTAELPALYAAASRGVADTLPPTRVDFDDYVRWQRDAVNGPDGERHWSYWKQQLGGELPIVDLATDRPRPSVQTYAGDVLHFAMPTATAAGVAALARAHGTTNFVVLLSTLFALLHRLTEQEDLIIGSPGGGRGRAEFDEVVGYFVNPLPLRVRVSRKASFATLLQRVHETVTAAIDHGEFPFALMLERLSLQRDPSRSPIFQTACTWNRLALTTPATSEDAGDAGMLVIRSVDGGQQGANLDLELAFMEETGGLRGWYRYNTVLFDRAAIEELSARFLRFVGAIIADPACRVCDLPLVDADERRRLLQAWNPPLNCGVEQPRSTLIERFEKQVERAPDGIAATSGGDRLTYRELNRRANQLASRLRQSGAGPEATVGVFAERSIHLPVAVLGILKCGAAYVPIDPQYPAERVRFMLADAQAKAVVTDAALKAGLPDLACDVLCVDDLPTEPDAPNPEVNVDPESLAYVIYTSGSTGRPKGVGVSHRNVIRLFESTDSWFAFGPSDVWTLFHSAAFDFSVWELWGALLYGGRLVVVPFWASRSPESFRALLSAERVTVLNQTPSAFRPLIEADGLTNAGPLALRYVIFGGEALDVRALQPWVARHGIDRPQLVNMYGITETTVHVTFRPLTRADVFDAGRSVIGEPIPDLATYVLDSTFEPAPIGLRGELFVGGAGVARGYLGRPRLTAERFVPDPFSGRPGARLYRSGDVARRLRDGDLEYLGRGDEQVKVRGFRIELGEIAQALRSHPAVGDVIVDAVTSDGETRITAFVVPDATTAGAVRRLSAWERDGRLDARSWCELPNGMAVVEVNRNETNFLYDEIFGDAWYLRHGVALRPGACVFDVGANIGMFSLYVASQHTDATVYAFEPIPSVYKVLALNAELHGLDIRPVPVAISDREGNATFTYYPKVSIFSGRFADVDHEKAVVEAFIRNQHAGADDEPALLDELLRERLVTETVQCPMTTISQVIRERGIACIDLLKVDVEKSELTVLQGIDAADWPKIRQVIVEVHDEEGRLDAVRAVLDRAGYLLTVDQDPVLAGTGLYSVYAVREHRMSDGGVPASRWSSPDRLVADLRQHLGRTLPDYMVPSSMVFLDALPLTSNGKLDRRALPRPGGGRRGGVAPRTPLEEQIAAVWRDVLKTESVGVTDDFFALGGHSLTATKIIVRLRSILSADLPLRVLFESPTVEAMALAVVEQQAIASDPEDLLTALAAVENGTEESA